MPVPLTPAELQQLRSQLQQTWWENEGFPQYAHHLRAGLTADVQVKRCFISYAWPQANREREADLQVRLQRLVLQLKALGVEALLDLNDLKTGMTLRTYMEEGISQSHATLLIVTPSLLERWRLGQGNICFELETLNQQLRQGGGYQGLFLEMAPCEPAESDALLAWFSRKEGLLRAWSAGDGESQVSLEMSLMDTLLRQLLLPDEAVAQAAYEHVQAAYASYTARLTDDYVAAQSERLAEQRAQAQRAQQQQLRAQIKRLAKTHAEYRLPPSLWEIAPALDEGMDIAPTVEALKSGLPSTFRGQARQVWALVGPVGSGRRTLLRAFLNATCSEFSMGVYLKGGTPLAVQEELNGLAHRLGLAPGEALSAYLAHEDNSDWVIVLEEATALATLVAQLPECGGLVITIAPQAPALAVDSVYPVPGISREAGAAWLMSRVGATGEIQTRMARQWVSLCGGHPQTMALLADFINTQDISLALAYERYQESFRISLLPVTAHQQVLAFLETQRRLLAQGEQDPVTMEGFEAEPTYVTYVNQRTLPLAWQYQVGKDVLKNYQTALKESVGQGRSPVCFVCSVAPKRQAEWAAQARLMLLLEWLKEIGVVVIDPLERVGEGHARDALHTGLAQADGVLLYGSATLGRQWQALSQATSERARDSFGLPTPYSPVIKATAAYLAQKPQAMLFPLRGSGAFEESFPAQLLQQLIDTCDNVVDVYRAFGHLSERLWCQAFPANAQAVQRLAKGYRQDVQALVAKTPRGTALDEASRLLEAYRQQWQALERQSLARLKRVAAHPQWAAQAEYVGFEPTAEYFVGRQAELLALTQRLQPQRAGEAEAARWCVLHGLGGMGKSALAQAYARAQASSYRFVAFIHAQTRRSLLASYLQLAEFLKLGLERPTDEVLITAVKVALESPEHMGWLLMVDNASDWASVSAYLPRKGGTLLATSRRTDWPKSTLLSLPHLDAASGATLLQQLSGRSALSSSPDALASIVTQLGGLPLALVQAGAYLRQHPEISLSAYEAALHHAQSTARDELAQMAKTWQVSVSSIQAQNPDAVKLLSQLGYFAAEGIPEWLLLPFCAQEDALLQQLGLLNRYGLITRHHTHGTVSLHRLVQQAMRHQDAGTSLSACLRACEASNPYRVDNFLTWERFSASVEHWEHVLAYTHGAELTEADRHCAIRLYHTLGQWALLTQRDPQRAVAYYRQAVEIGELSDAEELTLTSLLALLEASLQLEAPEVATLQTLLTQAERLLTARSSHHFTVERLALELRGREVGIEQAIPALRALLNAWQTRAEVPAAERLALELSLGEKLNQAKRFTEAAQFYQQRYADFAVTPLGQVEEWRLLREYMLALRQTSAKREQLAPLEQRLATLGRRLYRLLPPADENDRMLQAVMARDVEAVSVLLAADKATRLATCDSTGCSLLYLACERQDAAMVDFLIDQGAGAHVEHANYEGETPLHVASLLGFSHLVERLLLMNAEVEAQTVRQQTPLHLAFIGGHLKLVERLLRAKANPLHKDSESNTLLHRAAQVATPLSLWQALLENLQGAVNSQNKAGETACLLAAKRGDIDAVTGLLAAGAEGNLASYTGKTPLFWAAAYGHLTVVQCLFEAGADIHHVDYDGRTPLWGASFDGSVEVVRFLLENGAQKDIERAHKSGSTPLWIAAQNGHLAVVELLLKVGSKPQVMTNDNTTAFYMAAQKGHLPVVQRLFAAGVDIHQANLEGCTPLWVASLNGHLGIVQFLLENGAKKDIERAEKDGTTPLWVAAENGHLAVVDLLLAAGSNPKAMRNNKSTALNIAASNGHLPVVQRLFAAGVDIHQTDLEGRTPLWDASLGGHLGVVQFLLENGAQKDIERAEKDGTTPLYVAACNGHLAVVELLLAAGGNPKVMMHDNTTALYMAAQRGHLPVVQCLFAAGVDIHQANLEGRTPLWGASFGGSVGVVQFLLNNGALVDIERAFKNGATPLWIAAQNGHLAVVELLLKVGSKPQVMTNDNITALYIATQEGYLPVVQRLFAAGADIHHANLEGRTPLWAASFGGHVGVVQFLLENGAKADIERAEKDGATPLWVAAQNGHLAVVELLLEAGCNPKVMVHDKTTALCMAAQNGHLPVVQRLFAAGVDIHQADLEGRTPLWGASLNGHVGVVQFLLENGAQKDIERAEKNGSTPLFVAAQNGHLAAVDLLLAAGSNPKVIMHDNTTTLYFAAANGHLPVVQCLFAAGVDIHQADLEGRTPLWGASLNGHVRVVQFLLQNGAKEDLNKVDTQLGLSPLAVAKKEGHEACVRIIEAFSKELEEASDKLHQSIAPLPVSEQRIPSAAAAVPSDADDLTPSAITGSSARASLSPASSTEQELVQGSELLAGQVITYMMNQYFVGSYMKPELRQAVAARLTTAISHELAQRADDGVVQQEALKVGIVKNIMPFFRQRKNLFVVTKIKLVDKSSLAEGGKLEQSAIKACRQVLASAEQDPSSSPPIPQSTRRLGA